MKHQIQLTVVHFEIKEVKSSWLIQIYTKYIPLHNDPFDRVALLHFIFSQVLIQEWQQV